MTHEATIPSATLTDLIELFNAREAAGMVKYGTTVDRDDLSLADWLQHALEESMDKSIYLMRALKKLRASQPAEQPRGDAVKFAAWLIDHHEQDRVNEEGMQQWIAEFLGAQPKPEQAVGDGVKCFRLLKLSQDGRWETHGNWADGSPSPVLVAEIAKAPAWMIDYAYGPRPAVAMPAEVKDERTTFESWMNDHFHHSKRDIDPNWADVWEAWKARAALTVPCQVRKDGQGVTDEQVKRATVAFNDYDSGPTVKGRCWHHAQMRAALEAAALASPSAEAVVPEGWKVARCPDIVGRPAVSLTSPDGRYALYGPFEGERLVRDFLMATFPLATAPEVK